MATLTKAGPRLVVKLGERGNIQRVILGEKVGSLVGA